MKERTWNLAGEKREQNWWPFYTAGEIQEGAKTTPYLFLRARTGAQTRTIPSTPAGRSLPSPHAPPASACFALAPSLETLTGLLPHACMCPMLTCAAPYAPTLPAGGRGSCPWPSCARLPRSVPHQAPSGAREWRRTTPFTGPPPPARRRAGPPRLGRGGHTKATAVGPRQPPPQPHPGVPPPPPRRPPRPPRARLCLFARCAPRAPHTRSRAREGSIRMVRYRLDVTGRRLHFIRTLHSRPGCIHSDASGALYRRFKRERRYGGRTRRLSVCVNHV